MTPARLSIVLPAALKPAVAARAASWAAWMHARGRRAGRRQPGGNLSAYVRHLIERDLASHRTAARAAKE
ncbi:MAG TPA: hypothetical protein VFQ22_07700 [Longimicrobiales bacterium]|nr:hypothetical protein [Longimicrobiales bacterium]